MIPQELVTGPLAGVFSSSLVLIILLIMLRMSFRLYTSRRKKAYLSFCMSLALVIVRQLLLIGAGLWANKNGSEPAELTRYVDEILDIASFVLIHMGIYQLYNTSRRVQLFLLFALIILPCFVSFFMVDGYSTLGISEEKARLTAHVLLDFYSILLMMLALLWVAPRIGQSVKYRLALLVYFITIGARAANVYLYDEQWKAGAAIGYFLPVVYYLILFLILFDRVIELMQAIYHSSITDGLTGLYNRKFLQNRVHQYIDWGVKAAIVFCDIDNFKKLNDTKGHLAGDEALKRVAGVIRSICDDIGFVGRYGGEEIVVLITEPDAKPEAIANLIRERVEAETEVTLSIGYSIHREGVSAMELIKQADTAMYESKTTGKNKVSRFQAPRKTTSRTRSEQEKNLSV